MVDIEKDFNMKTKIIVKNIFQPFLFFFALLLFFTKSWMGGCLCLQLQDSVVQTLILFKYKSNITFALFWCIPETFKISINDYWQALIQALDLGELCNCTALKVWVRGMGAHVIRGFILVHYCHIESLNSLLLYPSE